MPATDALAGLTLESLGASLRSGSLSSVALTRLYLDRIRRFNPRLNAYLKVFEVEAIEDARRADEEIREGKHRGPIHGIPIAIKDIIDIQGHVTTAGAKLLPETAAREDAEVIRRLREAGAVILGKLNLHEFAWGGTNDNVHYGRCINPWKEGYSPGGSSGGSGAAVAAGLCAAALGTDTLASVRTPASYCGCVGLKPTNGLVSTRGVYPLSWSLDSVGPITRSVGDAEIMLRAMAGPDSDDPFSAMREFAAPPESDPTPLEFLRIGVIRDWALRNNGSPDQAAVTETVSRAIDHLVSLGCRRVDLDCPEIDQAQQTAIEIALADAAEIHREHLRRHADEMGADVRKRLEIGNALSATQVAAAHHRRELLKHRFAKLMAGIDCLVSPTNVTPSHAFDPRIGILSAKFTAAFNLLGYPAISIPCGFTDDARPVGLQIAAAPFQEWKILLLGKAYEASTPWRDRRPEGFDLKSP